MIAAGGTAGHVVPALAVADALRADGGPPPRIVFIGGERAERELVPAAGFELRTISVEGLSRSNPLKAARALGKAAAAVRAARRDPRRAAARRGARRRRLRRRARSGWRRRAAASRSC